MREVTVGVSQGEETSIETGLSPGELVVVDGTEKLREGSKVELRPASGPVPASQETQPTGAEPMKQGNRT